MSEHLGQPVVQPAVPTDLYSSGFHIIEDHSSGSVVLRLRGELDMATAPRLRQAVQAALDADPLTSTLTVDLGGISFIDSTGIGVLVAAARRAEKGDCSFVLRAPSPTVLKVLRITGLERSFTIETPVSDNSPLPAP